MYINVLQLCNSHNWRNFCWQTADETAHPAKEKSGALISGPTSGKLELEGHDRGPTHHPPWSSSSATSSTSRRSYSSTVPCAETQLLCGLPVASWCNWGIRKEAMQMEQEKACDFDKKSWESWECLTARHPQDWSTKNIQIWKQPFHVFLFCLSFLTFKVPSAGRIRCAATAAAPVGKPRFEMLPTSTKQLEIWRYGRTNFQQGRDGSGSWSS